jgi:uncharacterized MnhB-related membrane protein
VSPLISIVLVLTAVAGTTVALTRDPVRQTILLSLYSLVLASMFFILQAPDVGLSQIAVGTVALPLMLLLTLAKVRRPQ